MAKLMLSTEGEVVEEIQVDKDCLTIGRKNDNDIHIDSMSVSGHHAKLVIIEEDAFIQDLNSTNGTFVNAEKVTQGYVKDGDIISLGVYSLKFIAEASEEPAKKLNGYGGLPDQSHAHLQILNAAENQPDIIPITGKMITLGKPGTHVAAITQRNDEYYFVHVDGGDNDTSSIVNDEPVADKGQQLQDHDVIEVAGVKMEFRTG
jgi:hypothetical protein